MWKATALWQDGTRREVPIRQVGTDGRVCATTKATSVPGSRAQLVTWEEHHATLSYRFRDHG